MDVQCSFNYNSAIDGPRSINYNSVYTFPSELFLSHANVHTLTGFIIGLNVKYNTKVTHWQWSSKLYKCLCF